GRIQAAAAVARVGRGPESRERPAGRRAGRQGGRGGGRAGPYPASPFVTGARRYPDDTGRRSRHAVPAWITRVLSGDIASLRAEYCFRLAHLCACPPPVTGQLRILDFARLIEAIDQHIAEMRRIAEGR